MSVTLSKIHVKITIIGVENREHYYFIIICKCKKVPLFLFSLLQPVLQHFDSFPRNEKLGQKMKSQNKLKKSGM